MKIIIINGPNLNLLGTRETNIYGEETFEDYLSKLKKKYRQVELSYFQSNVEGELINYIQEFGFDCKRQHSILFHQNQNQILEYN